MKKLSNTEAELKKSVAYEKKKRKTLFYLNKWSMTQKDLCDSKY